MATLDDRMARKDVFGDGRMNRVSREARLLTFSLEALAEPTGCLKLDPAEIRIVAGMFLADADGMPPTNDQLEAWVSELVAAKWLVVYWHDGSRLGYIKGFGSRQRGFNVAIGVKETTGEENDHLPLPPCVQLVDAISKDGRKLPKRLPEHCKRHYDACPCEDVPTETGPPPATVPRRKEKRGKSKRVQGSGPELNVNEDKSTSRKGDAGGGTPPSALLDGLGLSFDEVDEFGALMQKLSDRRCRNAIDQAIRDGQLGGNCSFASYLRMSLHDELSRQAS